jgi:hypothetical protein
MSNFPRSPRLLKGAIIGIDIFNPLASTIVFQYNPEKMTRRVTARTMPGDHQTRDRTEVLRLAGPPSETISLAIEVDATDQLEQANPIAVASGVYPMLSALEMLVYPKTAKIIADAIQAQIGILEIIPPEAPLTLFVWGAGRVLPVRITEFSISELAYDTALNPILASVDLTMTVLSTYDLPPQHPGYAMYLTHQVLKETLATLNVANSTQNIGTALKIF